MSWVMVDVETTGPCPGLYSMYEIGAVVVRAGLKDTFHGKIRPLTKYHDPGAMSVCRYSSDELEGFDDAFEVMERFDKWLSEKSTGRPFFVSDNNGFDWQFVNYYFHRTLRRNPFGFSSTNLGSLYKGLKGDMYGNFKHLRRTVHDHNPVNDAVGNAEALLYMAEHNGLHIKFR